VSAHAALVGIGDGTTGFRAVGPGGLKIDGKGTGVTASESGGVLTVTAPVNNLKTGMSLRDDHLKKAIHADKNPTASLSVKRADLKFPEDNKTVTSSAKGTFKLNGVSQPMTFEYQVKRTGSDYHVQAKASLDITKFKIEKPCYLGVCVDETVQIKTAFKLREK
jgi:polyisoprenoid-binding protein YceI